MLEKFDKDNLDKHLQIKNIKGGYGEYSVLEDITIDVQSGEVVALLGPNGHGKSTLLKMISGLIPISSGEIIFNNWSYRPIESVPFVCPFVRLSITFFLLND